MKKKIIMVQGCTSDAGKSFLVTALCRHFARLGFSVAPFKAQNMSNQAAVTEEGLEIGRAQFVQALAARVKPSVLMNPVLLKPESETSSQVVVLGKSRPDIAAMPWMSRRDSLWPIVQESLFNLIESHEVVVIEGAGSPAEINLREGDIVNMSVALSCQAEVFLVADIDRGGAYAHLLGTWHCLAEEERGLLKGFVLNKFRGDPLLLGNAGSWLEEKTGVSVVALVPMIRHAIAEEDTWRQAEDFKPGHLNIGVVHYPYASNLDEFDSLAHEPGVHVISLRMPEVLNACDAVILPGSKNTGKSLEWLKEVGLDRVLKDFIEKGNPVLGICGGLQLLGKEIFDPGGLEGGNKVGLGFLDLSTTLEAQKITTQTQAVTEWGMPVEGYEIHHGKTVAGAGLYAHLDKNLGWRKENVTGVYLHGILDNSGYRQRFLESLGWSGAVRNWQSFMESEFDRAADLVVSSGWAEALGKS